MSNKALLLGGDLKINRLGYGAMRLTGQPGNFGPSADQEGCAGPSSSRHLLRHGARLRTGMERTAHCRSASSLRQDVVIATKGGIDKLSPIELRRDASAVTLTAQVDDALRNIKTERIDLFQLHWVDPNVPLEATVRALDDLRRAGKIRHLGLSNVTRAELDRAMAVAPITSV